MPDMALDYELLNSQARKIRDLKEQAEETKSHPPEFSSSEVGTQKAAAAMRSFHSVWQGTFSDAKDKLEKLAGVFENTAKQFAAQDQNYAQGASQQALNLQHQMWKNKRDGAQQDYESKKKAYEEEQEQADRIEKETGKRPKTTLKPPEKPTETDPPGSEKTDDGNGNTTSSTYTYDDDGNPTRVVTESHTGSGLDGKETTDYKPGGGYHTHSTDPTGTTTDVDGTQTTKEDGAVTTTVDANTTTTTDSDGKKETHKYKTTTTYDSDTHKQETTYEEDGEEIDPDNPPDDDDDDDGDDGGSGSSGGSGSGSSGSNSNWTDMK